MFGNTLGMIYKGGSTCSLCRAANRSPAVSRPRGCAETNGRGTAEYGRDAAAYIKWQTSRPVLNLWIIQITNFY